LKASSMCCEWLGATPASVVGSKCRPEPAGALLVAAVTRFIFQDALCAG
jgi:hypothetical protein